jgi:adenylate cyclase
MIDIAPEAARSLPGDGVLLQGPARPAVSARELYRRLVWLYVRASVAAVIVMFTLVLLGLDLSVEQWAYIIVATPIGVGIYVLPDIYVIGRQFRLIGDTLNRLDRGEVPGPAEISRTLVHALNLPFYSFVRVTFMHGPLATISILTIMIAANYLFGAEYALWQMLIFASAALFFASPTHAIVEYFSIVHELAGPITRMSPLAVEGILPEDQQRLVSIKLRSKLLYLSIFIAGLPLLFFACSILFKVDRMLRQSGIMLPESELLPLWLWVVGVVAICLVLALSMAIFIAAEVSRSAATLADAMRQVESGELDLDLHITSTDEYADLFRGFNHMIRGLREEVQLLEVTRGLAGELNLDILIQRIMSAASDLLDAERASLFVHDPKTDQLWSRYAAGLHTGEIRIPSHAGIAGTVFTTGVTENIPDVYADSRFDQSVDRATGYRTRSILCMPIVNNAGVRIGVTEVLNKKGGAAFSIRDEARLGAFTAQIAVLLENAKLFDEVLSVKNYNENILRSTSNGMITLDSEGRVVTANEAALEILKMAGDAVVGTPAAQLFSGDNAWVMTSMTRMEQTGQREIAIDARLKFADGAAVSVNLTAQPLFGPDGAPIGSMLVFEDITEETRVRSTMARYMSAEVVEEVLAGGESELGGKTQTVSILFSDVRNFTGVSEALGARETVSLLNEYFGEMVEVVTRHGGILDKYIGDAIMALFGAPFAKPEDADHALAVGNGMLITLRELNGRRLAQGKQPIDIGVGIATGEVVLGNIGSPSRMEYTVIGDKVNLASRLESANKYYHSKILLDETTVGALTNGHADCLREIDLLRVKGKDRPVAVYESLGYLEPGPVLEEAMDHFAGGLAAYRACDWERAMQRFAAALELRSDDEPSRMYIERCRHYRETPPPADWGGVWTLTEK